MPYTKEQRETFTQVVKPVIMWINDNCNPHSSVEITTDKAELKSDEICYLTKECINQNQNESKT